MSNRNNRVKRLEKEVRKFMQEHDENILRLDEENSDLRRQIDLQSDLLKEKDKQLRWEIEIHNGRFRFQRNQLLKLKKTVEDEKDKLLQVTGAVLDQSVVIENAKESLLGKFVFNRFRK